MALNLIETLKTSIYSPEDTKNTIMHVIISKNSKVLKFIFSKTLS